MTFFDLSDLVLAAARLQQIWDASGIEFCFIGGITVHHWGQPRQTNDVDATVWTEFGNERPVIHQLLQHLTARIAEPEQFAMQNRVLLVQESQGVAVDISLAAFPFERNLIDRSQRCLYGDTLLKICGPSDLIILKAFANRPHDWEDIRGVIIRSEGLLDWDLIESEVTILSNLKDEPEIINQLQALRSP